MLNLDKLIEKVRTGPKPDALGFGGSARQVEAAFDRGWNAALNALLREVENAKSH